MPLGWPEVIARRLARHHLLQAAAPDGLVHVASDVCGVHAQVGASADLMLGIRLSGVTREDVRDALWRKRTLVKTVGLRGTLHLALRRLRRRVPSAQRADAGGVAGGAKRHW